MMNKLSFLRFRMGVAWNDFLKGERGETNIIAIILIILVVIALVGFFNKQITELVKSLFTAIGNAVGDSGIPGAKPIELG